MLGIATRFVTASLLLVTLAPFALASADVEGDPLLCVPPERAADEPLLCVWAFHQSGTSFCVKEHLNPPAPLTWQDSTTCLPVQCPEEVCSTETPIHIEWPTGARTADAPSPYCYEWFGCATVYTTWDWSGGDSMCVIFAVETEAGVTHGNIVCTPAGGPLCLRPGLGCVRDHVCDLMPEFCAIETPVDVLEALLE